VWGRAAGWFQGHVDLTFDRFVAAFFAAPTREDDAGVGAPTGPRERDRYLPAFLLAQAPLDTQRATTYWKPLLSFTSIAGSRRRFVVSTYACLFANEQADWKSAAG
jgi:hypothetical protein